VTTTATIAFDLPAASDAGIAIQDGSVQLWDASGRVASLDLARSELTTFTV
jgi:hypothetical protein